MLIILHVLFPLQTKLAVRDYARSNTRVFKTSHRIACQSGGSNVTSSTRDDVTAGTSAASSSGTDVIEHIDHVSVDETEIDMLHDVMKDKDIVRTKVS